MSMSLCEEELEVQSYRIPPGASPSTEQPRRDPRDQGVSAAVWGEAGSPIVHETPRGVPIPQKAHAGPEGLGCIRCFVGRSWKFNHAGATTGPPYPPNSPSRTGGTWMYSPLCGQEREVQSYPTPAPEASLWPERPRQDLRNSGLSAAEWEGAGSSMVYSTHHGAYLSPKLPMQDRRDSGVCAAVWRGAGSPIIPDPPQRSVPIPRAA